MQYVKRESNNIAWAKNACTFGEECERLCSNIIWSWKSRDTVLSDKTRQYVLLPLVDRPFGHRNDYNIQASIWLRLKCKALFVSVIDKRKDSMEIYITNPQRSTKYLQF